MKTLYIHRGRVVAVVLASDAVRSPHVGATAVEVADSVAVSVGDSYELPAVASFPAGLDSTRPAPYLGERSHSWLADQNAAISAGVLKYPANTTITVDGVRYLSDGSSPFAAVASSGGGGDIQSVLYRNRGIGLVAGQQKRFTDVGPAPGMVHTWTGSYWARGDGSPRRAHFDTRGVCGLPALTTTNTGGTQDSFNQRVGLTNGPCAVSGIEVIIENTRWSGSSTLPGYADVTVAAAFSLNGTSNKVPVYFPNGSTEITLKPGESVKSQPCAINVDPGALLHYHSWAKYASPPTTFPSGNPIGASPYVTPDKNERGTNLANNTLGTVPSSIGAFAMLLPPRAMIAYGTNAPTVVVIGDSNRKWARDGLRLAGIAAFNTGLDGYSLANFLADPQTRLARLAEAGVTHALITISGNDVSSGQTAAQLRASLLQVAAALKGAGVIPIVSTSPPKTDNDNTAPTSAWANLQAYNAELLSSAGIGFGVFDLFDCWAAKSGGSYTGLWRTDLGVPTTDGTHTTTALHDAAAATFALAAPGLFS